MRAYHGEKAEQRKNYKEALKKLSTVMVAAP